jgi:hypothetical protein
MIEELNRGDISARSLIKKLTNAYLAALAG